MRGVVVLCLIFLVLPGQEVNATTTITTTTETPKVETTATTETPKPGTTATTEAPKPGTTATTEAPKPGTTATTEAPKPGTTATTEAPKPGTTATTEAPKPGITATTEAPKPVITATTEAPKPGTTATTEAPKPGTTATTESPKTETTATTESPKTETTATTEAAMTGTETSETPQTGTETTPESGVPSNTATSAASPTSSNPTSCAPSLCGNGSTCLQLHETYECRCPLNYHYEPRNKTCIGGDGFFGEFKITAENFNSNPESAEYTNLYMRVMNQSNSSLFDLDGYLGTIIIQMSLSSSKSQRSRRSTGEVIARVNHLFPKDATTADHVKNKIETNLGSFGTYISRSICDGFYCDPDTTLCTETPDGQGATCSCKEGKYSNPAVPEVTSCRDCSPECSQNEGKYCNLDAKTGAECACLPGYKSSGDTCKACEFGYSGANCADNYLLILVIVGAVLGVVVLALLGAVIGISVSSKKGKKSSDRTTLIERDEPALAGSRPDPMRIFPKVHAKPDLGEVNKAANFYEDNEEFSRNYPKRDYEENPWYEMARKDQNY